MYTLDYLNCFIENLDLPEASRASLRENCETLVTTPGAIDELVSAETLNMVDFLGDFYIYDSEEYDVFHDKWRVFAKDCEKPNSELPEDTTQRRCFKKWLLDGKKTGAGAGIFIYDGEKFTK